jgi:hypothetical protein
MLRWHAMNPRSCHGSSAAQRRAIHMYESKNEPLLAGNHFTLRVLRHLGLAAIIVGITLTVGVAGHLWLEPIHWHDAILNISLILAGIGPFIMPATVSGKLFFALYSILVGLVFVGTLGLVLAPLAHRLIHKFHLDGDND